ncbi:Double-stranded DNA-binding protein [uncultured Caudovirales phage]|uniref:Double-stranded DNA-binding protein n=1 Tax=uncultured Caudovirales phage TaxID=2100421 RepID=A0A6J5PEQ4_9CAUD|nr:Double-stranded DNA-binding protein [uncultured Caudovirales phage]CAB4170857.1 Double-stranded DNA-binding protein [uncultured Caudovirales phage]CAB4177119.1 Double-stranded DNA-binding protein [uncultured Caudovirales phage]CAB4223073.1 Double-stranded DNA-binding protein [uncultured Caudovirales phage]
MSINSESDRKEFNNALKELSNSMTRISAEKDLMKDITNNLVDKFQFPKKTVNKLAKIYHKQNFSEEVADFADLEALYEEVVNFPGKTAAK